jgi:site-specific DNA-methyltransferase (adenine-specific)
MSVPAEFGHTSAMKPYYEDGQVKLYLGDMREVLPALKIRADLVVADPPYQETSLPWDRWHAGWPAVAAQCARSMWCFGSMRMFLDRRDEFTGWRLSQDVVWEKPNGSGFAADRFKRVHEIVTHWYRGSWADVHRTPQREPGGDGSKEGATRKVGKQRHTGAIGDCGYIDDGSRLVRSVIRARNMHHRAAHPTEKPLAILDPLIRYGCPPGGLVVDMFAGSSSTLDCARALGMRAVGIEADEKYCEAGARRLSAATLFDGAAS